MLSRACEEEIVVIKISDNEVCEYYLQFSISFSTSVDLCGEHNSAWKHIVFPLLRYDWFFFFSFNRYCNRLRWEIRNHVLCFLTVLSSFPTRKLQTKPNLTLIFDLPKREITISKIRNTAQNCLLSYHSVSRLQLGENLSLIEVGFIVNLHSYI